MITAASAHFHHLFRFTKLAVWGYSEANISRAWPVAQPACEHGSAGRSLPCGVARTKLTPRDWNFLTSSCHLEGKRKRFRGYLYAKSVVKSHVFVVFFFKGVSDAGNSQQHGVFIDFFA